MSLCWWGEPGGGRTIFGSGIDATTIQTGVMSANNTDKSVPFEVAPILHFEEATGLAFEEITADGSLAGSGAAAQDYRIVGFH